MIKPGAQFGKLKVLGVSDRQDADGMRRCSICLCACGSVCIKRNQKLQQGVGLHCGCMLRESVAGRPIKHGGCGTSEYRCWRNLISRCTNPNHPKYPEYGGRGITVTRLWRTSGYLARGFARFIADVGPRPGPEYSLDRIRVNEGYSKDNCRWATIDVQANNKRNSLCNRVVTDESETNV